MLLGGFVRAMGIVLHLAVLIETIQVMYMTHSKHEQGYIVQCFFNNGYIVQCFVFDILIAAKALPGDEEKYQKSSVFSTRPKIYLKPGQKAIVGPATTKIYINAKLQTQFLCANLETCCHYGAPLEATSIHGGTSF